jgi:hypothetical protein
MARVKTSKGEAVLRPMLQKHEKLIGRMVLLDDERDMAEYFRLKAEMLDALDEATVSAEWEGGFGELPKDETFTVLLQWDSATDEDAVPEGSAPSSETPSGAGA